MSKVYFCSFALAFLFFELSNVDAKLSISQMKSIAKPWSQKCASKIGTSQELLEAHRRGEFPEDQTLMCYLLCNAKMAKIIDKNDQIDLATVKQQLDIMAEQPDVERMMTAFKTCADKMTATDPCRLAYEYSQCYYDMDPEIYMFS